VRYRVETDEATRAASQWPPSEAVPVGYYLGAPGPSGEGTLGAAVPPAGVWTMTSDPAGTDPCAAETATWFVSPPMAADVVVAGAPRLRLTATTRAADFDVIVSLYDYLAGPETYRWLGAGTVRARHRDGGDAPVPAGAPFDLVIDLAASVGRVRAGHELALSIAPSECFYAENPHTGEPPDAQTMHRTATIDFALGPTGAQLVVPSIP
jgi:predicted acyl esterase